VTIEVRDGAGALVRRFKRPAKLGVNRVAWDLQSDPPKLPPRGDQPFFREPAGPEVLPGSYTVTVKFRDHEASAPVTVVGDPRMQVAEADRRANWDTLQRAMRLQTAASEAIERLHRAKADVKTLLDRAKPEKEGADETADQAYESLQRDGRKLTQAIEKLEARLWEPPETKGIVANDDALSKIQYAARAVESGWGRPTPASLGYLAEAEAALKGALADLNELFAEDVAAFRAKVEAGDLELLRQLPPLEVEGE
jgi:hypothetical protein